MVSFIVNGLLRLHDALYASQNIDGTVEPDMHACAFYS